MANWDDEMTVRQAYLAMYDFLSRHHARGPSDEIGSLLGSASLLPDGESADPAIRGDFLESASAVLEGEAGDADLSLE